MDVVVDIVWSGISFGIEWLLWEGWMLIFSGMGYFFVFGYELVGCIVDVGVEVWGWIGEWVFVFGVNCYEGVCGLFGGLLSWVVVLLVWVMLVFEVLGV